jgi:hypothetical protein
MLAGKGPLALAFGARWPNKITAAMIISRPPTARPKFRRLFDLGLVSRSCWAINSAVVGGGTGRAGGSDNGTGATGEAAKGAGAGAGWNCGVDWLAGWNSGVGWLIGCATWGGCAACGRKSVTGNGLWLA